MPLRRRRVRQRRFRSVVALTYSVYAPRTNGSAVLSVERRVLACTGWAGETVGFFEQSLGVHVHTLTSLLLQTRLKGFPLWMSLFRPFCPRMKHVIEQPAIYGQVDEDHESTNGNLEGSSQTARIDKWNQIVFNKSACVP